MKTPARRRTTKYFAALSGMFVIAALVVLPSVQSRRLARTSIANPGTHSSEVPESKIATSLGRWNWMPNLAAPALAESVQVLAADCLTPKTSFIVGETVCARTDGVDTTTNPGNFYMNWIDSSANGTNGGTITQNPQYFLFVPQTADTWKASIGSVTPDDSSIISNPPEFTVSEGPAISTYDSTCTNPKTSFVLGETVCAKASGLAVNTFFPNRISWSDTEGFIRDSADITADPQTDTFPLPATQTSLIGGTLVDNRGTWRANFTRSNGRRIAVAPFTVSDPLLPAADLAVQKFQRDANTQIYSGNNVAFIILVQNNGPDPADNVDLVDSLPSGATLASFNQDAGPQCLPVNSQNCTIAEMTKGERAQFTAIYTVSGAAGTRTTSASVSSDTPDPDSSNDSSTVEFAIQSGNPGGTCTLTCPDDITAFANTTEGGERGAHVTYDEPEGTGTCGSITSTPASGEFFPVGTTIVTATSETGDGSCQFTITVEEPTGNVTISCPTNKQATADSDCETPVVVGTATAAGDNVTVFATRSDGRPMYNCDVNGTNCVRRSPDEPFPAGTTTITWVAYSHSAPGPYADADDEESKRTGSASCTQTVVITDVTAPVIGATDETIAADANCKALVPDYMSTVSDNCACASSDTSEGCEDRTDFTYTQSPAAGTEVGPGQHQVTITANDGSSNNDGAGNETTKTITLTVADQTDPVISCPANITQNTDPGQCSAIVNPGTATATDNCDSSVTITGTRSDNQALNAPYPKGTTTITWTATDDAGNSSECEQTVTVEDNEDPVIVCPAPTTASADANCEAAIPDRRSEATTSDNCGDVTVTQSPAPGTMVGLGTHTITLTATDSSGNTSTCETTFTVVDTTAPVITVTSQTLIMWPPNHKYKTFLLSDLVTGVSDNCSMLNTGNVVVASVSSDEPENAGGDGNTNNDIVIAADCKSIQLRAERAGSGDGRVYTINVVVKDQAGNVGAASIKVRVPKSGPNGTAVDSGPNYTVNGTCPP